MLFAVDDRITEKFVENNTKYFPGDEYLEDIERFTFWNTVNPRMISGKIQARFLQFAVMSLMPKSVLEVGTFTGYSAVAMANVIGSGSTIFTFEVNPQYAMIASNFFNKYGLTHKITLIMDDVRRAIKKTGKSLFDLILSMVKKMNILIIMRLCYHIYRNGVL